MATSKTTEKTDDRVELRVAGFDASGRRVEDTFIGINGVNYIIPAGKTVKVPKFVAEEYERAQKAREKAYANSANMMSSGADPVRANINTTETL